MLTFKEYTSALFESRGIFHPGQLGKQIIKGNTLYDVISTGAIDTWDTFKLGKNIILLSIPSKASPKFFTQIRDESKDYYLCGNSASTPPSKFEGFGWPNANKTSVIKLKPQDFKGISGKWLTVQELQTKLFVAIDVRSDLSYEEKTYLKTSFLHYLNGTEIQYYDLVKSNKNTILKDFGEILGGVWYLFAHSALRNGKIFYPEAGNEPLIDSIVQINKVEVKISSKSGTGVSNTVKGGDIFKIIDNLPPSEKKHAQDAYHKELSLLQFIVHNSTIVGTIEGFKSLEPDMYRNFKSDIDGMSRVKKFKDMIGCHINPELIKHLRTIVSFNDNKAKADINTMSGALALMSKYIEVKSRSMQFAELSDYVLHGRVTYIRADSINNKGVIAFRTSTNNDTAIKSAYLRYKGSINRSADKLGIST